MKAEKKEESFSQSASQSETLGCLCFFLHRFLTLIIHWKGSLMQGEHAVDFGLWQSTTPSKHDLDSNCYP